MAASYRRSATYFKQLAEVAQKQALIEHYLSWEKDRLTFEKEHAIQIEKAYELLERAAKRGSIRIFKSNENAEVLFTPDIMDYLSRHGFEYSHNTIEWCHAKDELR